MFRLTYRTLPFTKMVLVTVTFLFSKDTSVLLTGLFLSTYVPTGIVRLLKGSSPLSVMFLTPPLDLTPIRRYDYSTTLHPPTRITVFTVDTGWWSVYLSD